MKNSKLELVGFCGVNCSKCDVYLATITNDRKKKVRIVEEATLLTNQKINPDEICCYGCRNPKSKHREYIKIDCIIHKCAMEKDVVTCGHCPYYPCVKIQTHCRNFSMHPEKTIEKMDQKMKALSADCSNIDLWLKKTKKY